jgi:hypothetical protein
MKDIVSNYTMTASCYMYPFNRPTIFISLASVNTIWLLIYLSFSFLLLPLSSIGHLWNALFHFNFLILRQSVGLLGQGISPSQGRYLYKHRVNTKSMPWVGFEPTIPAFERAKTVAASDRAAIAIGYVSYTQVKSLHLVSAIPASSGVAQVSFISMLFFLQQPVFTQGWILCWATSLYSF